VKPVLFRLKIALLSLAISGIILLAFGVFFLAGIRKVGMDRIDREIRALGESQLRGPPHPREFWAGFERSLEFIQGPDRPARLFVQVRDFRGDILFSSGNCPAEVSGVETPEMPFVDNVLSTPLPAAEPEDAPARAHFIDRLDRDDDGRVSPDEFDGPPDRFGDFDGNRDGYIDEGEAPTGPPAGRRGDRMRVAQLKEPVFQTMRMSSGPWRVGIMGNDLVIIVVGASLADFQAEANRFQRAFFLAAPLALLLLAAGGWLLATRALRPIALITRTAEGISARDLSQRVPAMSADAELTRLVEVINGMLARLERSYNQAVRFSGDAAHELQTPLTILQGELDNAVQAAVPGSEEQQRYGVLLEEVQRLKAVMQKLLLLARADAGRLALNPREIDLSALLASAAEDVEAMASNLRIERHIQPDVRVSADEELLGQAIRNLTTNAVKYNRDSGLIQFELKSEGGIARFTLRNTGDRIPPEDRGKIFDRFYRVDKSRARDVAGAGLGLSLAREIARAHGGDLVLDPDRDGLIAFTLTLPASLA
jgi:signal transduction histidine kinase